MADYQKMYYVLMDAVDRAVSLMEQDASGFIQARDILISGAQRCEDIYICTSPESRNTEDS